MTDVWIEVVPLRDVVLMDVPWRSTVNVAVETGSVVVLATILVERMLEVKV